MNVSMAGCFWLRSKPVQYVSVLFGGSVPLLRLFSDRVPKVYRVGLVLPFSDGFKKEAKRKPHILKVLR